MADNPENPPDNCEQVADNSQELPTMARQSENPPEPEKKARGRPKGSKDSAPRKPRVIVEVAPEPEPPEPVKRARTQAPPRERVQAYEPPQPPDPPSPRTMFRQASETLAALQGQREAARRQYWQEAIAKSLR